MPRRRAITGRSQEPRRRYAEEIRLLRRERGLSLRQLAEEVGWDPSLFGKLESGASLGSPEVAQALDHYYETPRLLLALWELAVSDPTQFKEQYRRYMLLEGEAVSLSQYSVSIVPGLLQTDAYAREVLALGGWKGRDLERQVEARTGRRKLLEGSEDVPPFRALLAEAVLRTPLSDRQEWRAQLEFLAEAGEREHIKIQVMPHSAGLSGLVNTDVMFLRLLDGATVAYTENSHRGELIEESAAVEPLLLAYDAMRDAAMNLDASRAFILRLLEEVPCEPST
ncbi:helix-turn-helix domain-containing protein [Streptomyces sp. ACT015]|uniref:helix-turn-helix domain-containing protein n=1 Tax=Streptomyces sp. ACT015 TaxID=3134807 RepID=UPI003D177531